MNGKSLFQPVFYKVALLVWGDNSQKEKNVITYLTTIIKM